MCDVKYLFVNIKVLLIYKDFLHIVTVLFDMTIISPK